VIKVSIKEKKSLSSAEQNSVFCPGSGADKLKQLLLPRAFKLLCLQSPFLMSSFQLASRLDCEPKTCSIQETPCWVFLLCLWRTLLQVQVLPCLLTSELCHLPFMTPQYLKDISNKRDSFHSPSYKILPVDPL
jgi:hypothetical protein